MPVEGRRVLVAFLAILVGCGTPETPEAVAEAFTRALVKGDMDEAVRYVAKEQKDTFGQDLRKWLELNTDHLRQCGALKAIQVKTEPKTDSKAPSKEVRLAHITATFERACAAGETSSWMVREDGVWKIG